jgi:hypothetical protein
VAGGASNGLDEGALGAEEALFVGVQYCYQRDFGEVEAFAEEIDADEDVLLAFAEVAEEFDAFGGFDFGVQVSVADAYFGLVAGEVFGHALGESVTRTRWFFAMRSRISATGSMRPVGRMICSTTTPAFGEFAGAWGGGIDEVGIISRKNHHPAWPLLLRIQPGNGYAAENVKLKLEL